MQKLRMEHIYKSYGQAVVLQDFSYAFTPGGITMRRSRRTTSFRLPAR